MRIHNISIVVRNHKKRFLGSLLGEVEDVHYGETGDCLGKFLRVRMNIDITGLLRRVLRLP